MLLGGVATVPPDLNMGDMVKSAQFRDTDACYMARTFVAGNTRLWTLSAWLKLGYSGTAYIGTTVPIFMSDTGTNNANYFTISISRDGKDKLTVGSYDLTTCGLTTTAVFRDPSAFYHLVVVMDSDNATVTERIRIYINGVRITSFDRAVYPTAQRDFAINGAFVHRLGRDNGAVDYIDAMISRVCFVGGAAHEASAFGYLNTYLDTWVTKPFADIKALADAGGVNSCLLEFLDSASFGLDSSTKANNWTPDRLKVTDNTIDVPGDSIVQMNQLDKNASLVLADTGRSVPNSSTTTHRAVRSTFRIPDGKWYSEFQGGFGTTVGTAITLFGVSDSAYPLVWGTGGNLWAVFCGSEKRFIKQGVQVFTAPNGLLTTSRGRIAIDRTLNRMWIGIDAVWYNSTGGTNGNPETGANPTFSDLIPDLFFYMNEYQHTGWIHSGRSDMRYATPAGFQLLSQKNLPADETVIISGSFTGNALADGPFVWMNGVPKTLTINGNVVTFGTHADKLANGFKLRTAAAGYNATGANTWAATIESNRKSLFKYNNSQLNP